MPSFPSPRSVLAAASLLVALALPTSDALAQRKILRVGPDTSVVATSPVAALPPDESADRTLEALRASLRLRPDDAVTLHAIGMRLFQLSAADWSAGAWLPDPRRAAEAAGMHVAAIDHLQKAVAAAPDSVRFAVDLGAVRLSGFGEADRRAALLAFDAALAAAQRTRGAAGFARVADSIATLFWTRYDRVAHREPNSFGNLALPGELGHDVDVPTKSFRVAHTSESWPGAIDHLQAELLLHAALAADSTDARVGRHMLRLLVERDRWPELLDGARRRQRLAPTDPMPWLAEGLAAHRAGRPGAEAAFARALTLAGPADSARLASMSRILPPSDGARISRMTPVQRAAFERRAWSQVDPLWSTPPNELRVEFIARVAFAELRWSGDHDDEERGVDTDAGLAYVRAGPPDRQVSYIPNTGFVVQKAWKYADGARVVLNLPLGARAPFLANAPEVAEWRARWAVSWHNVPILKSIAPLPALAARFRAPGDSADVYVAGLLPLDHLLPSERGAPRPLQVDFWLASAEGERLWRDSTLAVMPRAGAGAVHTRVWRKRMPAGTYMYRVEALQPETARGARGAAVVSTPAGVDFALRGFGVSDVLVAERVEARVERPARWTDYTVAPSAGVLRTGQRVALLWESYDLARTAAGTNRYRVELAVLPAGETKQADFTVRVSGGSGGVGLTGRAGDRVALGFVRELPARPTHVDDVELDLGATPPGTYLVRITLTDLVTSKRDRRETVVTVTR